MNRLESNILDRYFPTVKAGVNGRYDKDDILNVLNFMKENPNIQIRSIAEYAKISLGTLVSWRKKYGVYLGIKTKQYTNSESSTISTIDDTHDNSSKGARENAVTVQIPISMIQELRKLYQSGSKAEMAVNNTLFKVDDQYLYVTSKA